MTNKIRRRVRPEVPPVSIAVPVVNLSVISTQIRSFTSLGTPPLFLSSPIMGDDFITTTGVKTTVSVHHCFLIP
jgi:hypothetical protein